ncbi:hypothetical protein K458DRAFT_384718 [Lentithecium fluviatile CBS 122367]|uniref:Heterokaryon incompatibility domain-containing protein n=1 Tax=Lentithecium fluviatile CBS 122367 TaxID=1168545 RepID=A0A6G1JD94_9PLEO|nr:hypothetical protein K458DRAFT_384718 [Lentithecium fluviatile CBS 122367]
MAQAGDFSHSPLDLSSLRLILKTYDVADANLYTALSYTWGTDAAAHPITINGSQFLARQNLWDFLLMAREQLSDSLFWIDQICID